MRLMIGSFLPFLTKEQQPVEMTNFTLIENRFFLKNKWYILKFKINE